jgi:hypothetical protein
MDGTQRALGISGVEMSGLGSSGVGVSGLGLGGLGLGGPDSDLFGREHAERAERLAALREQRMLLTRLRFDIDTCTRLVAVMGQRNTWRSSAGRGYAGRREELRHALSRAQRQVAGALEAVERAILATAEE